MLKVGLLAAGLVLGVGPAAAWAQGCPAVGMIGGVLVETIEQTEVVPGDAGFDRHARATERGDLGAGCGSLASFQGRMTVRAESWVPILDPTVPLLGEGPIAGSFHVFPAGGGASIKGVLDGRLDFAPTHQGYPWVTTSGRWWTNGRNATEGNFSGLALVPVPCPTGEGLCYYDPTGTLGDINQAVGAAVVPLTEAELVPAPSAKFLIWLSQ